MNPLVECLGWTLVHFLWQGAAVALLLAMGLRLLRRVPSSHRYLAGCAALLLMVIAPGITFQIIEQRLQPSPQPAVEPVSFAPQAVEITPRPASTAPKVISTAKPIVPAPSVTQRLETLLPWLVVGWSIGVLALSCRLLVGWLQIKRLQRHAIESLAEPWHEKLAELAKRLNLERPVRLFQSALIEVPTVIGWLRPVILLPASCLVGLTPAQLESILAHELAHIRRHDYLVNLLQSMVETLLFYHPAVWWVSRRIREERENCCDDIAVNICGDPIAYARALATLEEMRPASAQLALAASGGPLLQRIQRLLGTSGNSTSSPTWPLAGVIIAIMIITLATNLRGNRAMAADTLTPETFLTGLGVYHYTNDSSALELTVRSNQLLLSASDDSHHTSAGVNTWNPGRHWFLYVAKGRQVWAYDGNSGLWLLRADLLTGSGSESIGWLREPPPAAVVKRLPKAVVQRLPPPLETRKFQLNPKRFVKALEDAGFSPRDVEFNDDSKSAGGGQVNNGDSNRQLLKLQIVIRQFLMSNRVAFAFDTLLDGQNILADTNAATHGKTFYYDERTGVLWVRATSQELDKISSAFKVINNGKQPDTAVGTKSESIDKRASEDSHDWSPTQTLTDANGNTTLILRRDPSSDAWTVDGQSQLSKQWFYYRLTNSNAAASARSLASPLETRKFRLDSDKFVKALEGAGFSPDDVETNVNSKSTVSSQDANSAGGISFVSGGDRSMQLQLKVRQLFKAIGIDLNTNNSSQTSKAVYFDKSRGILFVRATTQELDRIGSTLEAMNTTNEGNPVVADAGKNAASAAASTYSISSTAPANDESELLTRTYLLDANGRSGGLKKNSAANANGQSTAQHTLEEYLVSPSAGLYPIASANTNVPSGYILNFGTGTLTVRARKPDQDKIREILFKPAPQDSNSGAQLQTLTDGDSTVTLSLTNPGSGMDKWKVDGQNQLSQQWFYYRIGKSGAANPMKSQPGEVSTNAIYSPSSVKDDSELLIRTYPLDINALLESMKKTNGTVKAERQSMAEQALQEYFAKAGISLHSLNAGNTNGPAGYILSAGRARLLVHARKTDLDKINPLVAKLAPKPFINIKVKFVEIDEAASRTKGFDWILKDSLENGPEPAPKLTWSHATNNSSIGWPDRMTSNFINHSLGVTNSIDPQFTRVINAVDLQLSGILTEPQYHVAIETLEQRNGTSELPVPEVTTESGRQCQVQAVDFLTAVVGPCATNVPRTEVIPVGPTLDVIPSVSSDGRSIEMKAIATVSEFLGYDLPGRPAESSELVPTPKTPVSVATPVIRLRQMAFGSTVHDGQTIVLGCLGPETVNVLKDKVPVLGDIPLAGRLFRSKSSGKSRKNLLVFVTPTLINPDGTRYHSTKELADVGFLVPPPQPSISQKAD